MTDLVTDAAIDAAEIARRLTPDYTDALIPVLAAVAPFIAAEALRQAAEKFRADCNSARCDSTERSKFRCSCPYDSLMAMARMLELDAELEGKAELVGGSQPQQVNTESLDQITSAHAKQQVCECSYYTDCACYIDDELEGKR